MKTIIQFLSISFLVCVAGKLSYGQNSNTGVQTKRPLTEISSLYTEPITESMYSKHVSDTFKIFKSFPEGYLSDTTTNYPIIIILDANAFFESVVSQLKFTSFIGEVPKAILIGVGYNNFTTMDSLRTRDYTFPKAIPEYEMNVSGGAEKFKQFIDDELLPKLNKEYRINLKKSALCGHSLAGYFSLFYSLKSAEEKSFHIKNIVSASPSLHYNHRYIFNMAKAIKSTNMPMKIYISMGSGDMTDNDSKDILSQFVKQVSEKKFTGLQIKEAEYTNFGHIDAAIPGFIKGLTYIYQR
ncbi:MAG TPA: alpha/beta hydrolase-fold protein [Pedobacter sp.]|jgi:hypothetical protein